MIWYDHASEGVGASEDDVAPFLPIDGKSDPLEHFDQLLAGNVRRKLHYRVPVLSSKYSLPASVGTGSPEAIQSSM